MIITNLQQLNDFKNVPGNYKFKNKENDWNYCGETNNLYRRIIQEHLKGKGKHYIDYFIKEHGFDIFEIELIDWGEHLRNRIVRLALETACIDFYDSLEKNSHGYNLVLFGSEAIIKKTKESVEKFQKTWEIKRLNGYIHPNKGIPLTEEHKNNISKVRTGKMCGKDNPNFGKRPSQERIEKQRLKILGTKQSEDTKNKRSETFKTLYKNGYKNPMIGRIISKEEKAKYSQKVKQIDKNTGEVIKIWDSITEASNNMGFKSKNSIRQASQPSKRKSLFKKSAGGFYWEYV